jgi:hypothetical protein
MHIDEIKARLAIKFADEYKMAREAVRGYSTEALIGELESYSKELRAQFARLHVWDCSYMNGSEGLWNAGRTSKELHHYECPWAWSEVRAKQYIDIEFDVDGNVWCNVIRDELAFRFDRDFIHEQVGYDS